MKKYLPIILFVLGLGVVSAAIFFVVKGKKTDTGQEEETALLKDIALLDRPVARLIPTDDGHWLKLTIENLKIDAESLDYELLYKLPDGRTQGVPGTVSLKGQKEIKRDLLLGSESSGKFRYDEGVENGTLTLRFRNDKGKLLVRFSTDFRLLTGTTSLDSKDSKLTVKLSKAPKAYFVVMETFGVPQEAPGEIVAGPYGLFASDNTVTLSGDIEISDGTLYRWTGSAWSDKDIVDTGIFIGVSSSE